MPSTLDFLDQCDAKVQQLRKINKHESADTINRLLNIIKSYQAQLIAKDRKLEEIAARLVDARKEAAELRATGNYNA